MKGFGKRVTAGLLCVTMVFQLSAIQAEAGVTKTQGLCEHHTAHTEECGYSRGDACEHVHTADCYGDIPVCDWEEETATGSNASHVHTDECYELDCAHERGEHDSSCGYEEASFCEFECSECAEESKKAVLKNVQNLKNTLAELEEDKDNFTLGTQSRITSDEIGGNILEITSGWNSDRRKGVIKFKNGAELFKKEAFTMNAYVYNTGTHERGTAVTIGAASNYFSINLYPAALKYSAGGEEQTELMGDRKFANEWISLSISYEENENEGMVTVYVDGEEILSETGIGFKMSELDSVEAYIGGTFADTSYMGIGKYDHIAVADGAVTDGLENELASASNAVRSLEAAAEDHDFTSDLEGCQNQAEAQAAIEAWVLEAGADIIEEGMTVRTAVSEYTEPGEPHRESLEGKPGSVTFSFKLFNGGAAVTGGEMTVAIPAAKEAGEIPVYDSFSGTASGTGSGSEERSLWLDTEGIHIQAHGGQVQGLNEREVGYDLDENGEIEDKNVWLWYGEDKTRNGKPIDGVRCYVSTDLYNWTNKGTVLRTHDLLPAKLSDEGKFAESGVSLDEEALGKLKSWAALENPTEEVSQKDIDMAKNFLEAYVDSSSATGYDEENLELAFWNLYTGYGIAERPKMLYNEKTSQYIVIYHQDAPSGAAIETYVKEILENGSSTNTGSRYSRASMGFAVSDSPFGPFKLVNVQRLNGLDSQGEASKLGMARDMNVFLDDTDVDKNGVKDAYAFYSSEENAKMYISLLNADYTGPVSEGTDQYLELEDGTKVQTFATRVLPDNSREAPAVFKFNGYYYMITSGTSGWNPNPATYYRAENIFGPWTAMGDPCEGGSSTTFRSQSTCVIPVDAESGQFIYMGDRWRTEGDSSALWYSSYMWVPVQITSDNRIILKNEANWDLSLLEKMGVVKINTELPETVYYGSTASLPSYLNVTVSQKTFDTPVVWDAPSAMGTQVITGTLTDLDRSVSFEANVAVQDVLYFVDCGAASATDREYFNTIKTLSAETMRNPETPDQQYSNSNGWGYEGNNTKARTSGDLYEMLRYVSGGTGRDLSYRFDQMEPGTYSVYLGFFSPTNWPSDKRVAKISVKAGENAAASEEHKISCGVKDMVAFEDIVLDETGSLNVVISPKNSGNNTDMQISYIAVCRKPVITVESELKAVDMDNPVMPETLTVKMDGIEHETRVIWNQAELENLKNAVGTHSITGVMSDLGDRPVAVEVMALPANAVYFVDNGAGEAGNEFKQAAELSAGVIRNSATPDQPYAEGGWGYEGSHTTARISGNDVYEMLRYVQKNSSVHNISYRFDKLDPGTYDVRIGFFDPWYQYSKGNRKAEITAEINGEQQGKAVTHTITSSKDMVSLTGLLVDGEGNLRVNLESVNPGNDTDVMVSYLAVCKTADAPEEKYYTVNFEANGGTVVESQTVKEGEYAVEPVEPKREGYRFAGWYKDAELTEAWNFVSDVVTEDTTIYARWEEKEPEITYYTVSFETSGGTAVESQTVEEGEYAAEPIEPKKEGSRFAGWYKDAGLTEAWNFASDVVTADTTIYAKWEEKEPEIVYYTVNFEANGGTTVESQTVKEGEYAAEPIEPKKEGYRFAGWYKDAGLTEAWNFASDVVTADTTIYAKWEEKEPEIIYYTVNFETNGGMAVESQTVKEGEYAVEPTEPKRDKYHFAGWYKDAGFAVVWDFASDMVTEDTTIYARWEEKEPEITYYTVSFETSGGTAVESQTVEAGDRVNKPEEPEKEGYHFAGWYKDSGFAVVWDFASDVVTEDTTIFAKWTKKESGSNSDTGSGSTGSHGSASGTAANNVLIISAPAEAMIGHWEQPSSGTWYFVKENGSRAVNEWGLINGSWYLFDRNAVMVKGWAMVNNVWYYLDAFNGDMKTGWQLLNGIWYYFDPVSGAMKTGWLFVNETWYYLNPTTGEMVTGHRIIGGKAYDFKDDGSYSG